MSQQPRLQRRGTTRVADLAAAMKDGFKVVACENTMRAQKLAMADMLPRISSMPAGVVELMKKHEAGWAYI